jgi:hypothetical protein
LDEVNTWAADLEVTRILTILLNKSAGDADAGG